MLFRWAYGGGFVIQTMVNNPALFNAYIAASPLPLTEKISTIDRLLSKNTTFDRVLYFTSGTDEGVVKEGTDELDMLLSSKAPETIHRIYREFDGEEHRSTPFTTLYHGIKAYYHYYPELHFSSLEEFIQMGGMPYVYSYYAQRAKQFGFSPELTQWTMFTLTRNAIRANDYSRFDAFVNDFKGIDFIGLLRVNRACSIAAFYLKNKRYDKAISIFTFLAQKHPNSERPLNGLGDVYFELKDEQKASQYYQKAKDLTDTENNPN